MTERSYKNGRFRVRERSVYIYCTVCDSLVTIRENTIEYANNHLNECITKSTKKHLAYSNPIQKKGGRIALELSKDEIYEICDYIWDPSYLLAGINYGDRIQAKDMPAYYQNLPILYDHYSSQSWVEKKREQIVEYSGWNYMLKWLSNPEYYRIDKYLNNGNENFVRSSEYVLYKCKLAGKHYQYNLLDIGYYKTGNISINGETTTINFSDLHNNCEYMRQIFWSIDSLLK
ncbi:hypothetical protein GLOIN_2v1489014 [Rhizophagus irregularis DAOM 181602=DAOM 197198]|nr:hypothetical protein GLOIN_2v1489014 [Rhizophagus irregularis DAOM 181602=DAOM 197198]